MVARRFDTNPVDERVSPGFAGQLFETWRHAVTRARNASAETISRLSPAEKPAARPAHWLLHPGVVWLGDASLVLGAALGVAISQPGLPRTLAIWAGIQSVVWAVVRWLLMTYASGDSARDRSVLLAASSFGLAAYAVAATPELRGLAWAVSAAMTWRALVLLGDDRRDAGRIVAVAWGAQAAVVVASWIARSGVLAYLLTRG